MGKKTLRDSWSHVRFSIFVHGSDKLFARRILQSIRCHLRSFFMHPFNYDADKLTPFFNSMLPVQSNQSISLLQVSECTACLMHQCTKRRSICTGVGLDTWVTVSCSWVHLGWGEIQRCMTPTPHQTTTTEVNPVLECLGKINYFKRNCSLTVNTLKLWIKQFGFDSWEQSLWYVFTKV